MGIEKYNYSFDINPPRNSEEENLINDWCVQNIGRYDVGWASYYSNGLVRVYFTNEKDLMLFALRFA